MHLLLGFLFLNFVWNAFEFDTIKPLGYRMFFHRQYFDKNAANTVCCNNLCTQDNIDLIYSMNIVGNVTLGIQGSITKNGDILNIDHVEDINHERLYDTDSYQVVFRLICKDSLTVLSETIKNDVNIYPYSGLLMVGDNTGSNAHSKIDAAIKGICPGRAGPSCKKVCAETETSYCDHITGDIVCKNGKFGINCESTIQSCTFNPCGINGKCVDDISGYKCICNDESTGDRCQYPVCNKANCEHGTCNSEGQCVCESRYTGISCNIFKESDILCNQRGNLVASELGVGSICNCTEGYFGKLCETTCDPICSDKEKCVMDGNNLRCIPNNKPLISESALGAANADLCNPNPCKNGATCIIANSSVFVCRCTEKWLGELCQFSHCINSPCYNGICQAGGECLCYNGFVGESCEFSTCETYRRCQNGAKCTEANNFLECRCDHNSQAGRYCQYTCAKRCIQGTCELTDGIVQCLCQSGWEGDDCSHKLQSPCLANTCLHAGICHEVRVRGERSFECACIEGRTGKRCELSTCSQGMCLKGLCFAEFGCVCINNYSGEKCDIPTCPPDNSICTRPEQCYVAGNKMFCKCNSKEAVGLRCEHECKPACSINGECKYVDGEAKCMCFAGFRGVNCDEVEIIPVEPLSVKIYILVIVLLFILITTFAGVIARSRFTRQIETLKNIMSHAADTFKAQRDAIYGNFAKQQMKDSGLYANMKVPKEDSMIPLY